MRKLREIVRLHLQLGQPARAIARSCSLSPSTALSYVYRIDQAKLSWPLPPEFDDDAVLERLLFPDEKNPVVLRPEPDWAQVHIELRKPHVTKTLLWQEYKEQHPDGFQYSRFCEQYARWAAHLAVTMRQVHRAGEKMFVDFSGDTVDVVDRRTGECRPAKLFVAVLGASNYTYVEPVFSEDLPTWIGCHVRACEFFDGVTEIWVPDNLKSGVTSPDRYDPEINQTYAALARHYDVAVIPARVRKPRDKAKVEQGVLLAERWILAVLRNRTFYSLEELREAIRPLLEKLNNKPMQRLKKSRRELFEEIERPMLRKLPARAYELEIWASGRVGFNYHVTFEGNHYSAPFELVKERLEIRATETVVEFLRGGRRITSHVRCYGKNQYVTQSDHMPRHHRAHAEWTPERISSWAKKVGPATVAVVEEIMKTKAHAEQGFNACRGLLRLRESYSDARLEKACERAVAKRTCSYHSVRAILKYNLDREAQEDEAQRMLPLHDNVRGADYYH